MHTYPRKNERLRHYVRSYDIRIVHIAAWKISDFGIVSNYVREYVHVSGTYTPQQTVLRKDVIRSSCHHFLKLETFSHDHTQLLS